jgi:hypothetical protein
MEEQNSSEEFDIRGMVDGAFPDRMITNWIVIAESLTEDGSDLHIATSDGMTAWLASGMINCAGEIILTNSYSTQEGEEDE